MTDAPPVDGQDAVVEARRAGPLRLVLTGLLLVVLVAALVVGTVSGLRYREQRQLDDAREDALRAARQEVVNLTSISARDLEARIRDVLAGATGEFKDSFEARSADLRKVVTDNQVQAQSRVLDTALVLGDRDNATVLVVADATVKNKAVPAGNQQVYRLKLQLVRDGSRWLTSTFEFVG